MIDNKTLDTTSISGGGQRFSALIKTLATPKFLFWFFLFVYIFAGFYLFYDGKVFVTQWNVYFYTDIIRYFMDITRPAKFHLLDYHPFWLFFICPIVSIIKGIVHDPRLAAIISFSLISSIINCSIFSILKRLSKNSKISLIFTFIYGLSFSCIMFSSIVESYLVSTFFLVLFWNYVLYLCEKEIKQLSFINLISLVILGVGSFGIIFLNFIGYILGIIYLLRKVYKNDVKAQMITFLKIILGVVLVSVLVTLLLKLAYPRTPYFFKSRLYQKSINLHFNKGFILKDVLMHDFVAPLTAIAWTAIPKHLHMTIWNIHRVKFAYPALLFYIISLVTFAMSFKNIKCKSLLGIFFSLIVVNFIVSLLYAPDEAYLFNQNYLYLLILLLGVIYSSAAEKYRKFLNIFLCGFLAYEVSVNLFVFYHIRHYLATFDAPARYNTFVLFLFTVLIALIIYLFSIFMKKVISKDLLNLSYEKKYAFCLGVYFSVCIISMVFISIGWWRL